MDFRDKIIKHYHELLNNGFEIEYYARDNKHYFCTENKFVDLAIMNGTVRLLRYRPDGVIVTYEGVNIGFSEYVY